MSACGPKQPVGKAIYQYPLTVIKGAKLNADKVNKWLTLGANLGVLAGIILLAFEISQSSRTSKAEMISNFQDRWITIDMSWQDAEFASAWAKAMENPEDLSVPEMIQVSGHLFAFIDLVNSNRRLWELGVMTEPMATPEQVIAGNVGIFFGNKFAQSWWIERRSGVNTELVTLIDGEIEKLSATRDFDFYERIRQRISD